MEEEQRQVKQIQESVKPVQRADRFALGFMWGLAFGIIVILLITFFAWKLPLDNATSELDSLKRQLSSAKAEAREFQSKLKKIEEALKGPELPSSSPTPIPTPSPAPTSPQ